MNLTALPIRFVSTWATLSRSAQTVTVSFAGGSVEPNKLLFCRRSQVIRNLIEEVDKRKLRRTKLSFAGFDNREIEQIVNQSCEPLGALFDAGNIADLLVIQRSRNPIQHVDDETFDGRERRPQLVGDIGKKGRL